MSHSDVVHYKAERALSASNYSVLVQHVRAVISCIQYLEANLCIYFPCFIWSASNSPFAPCDSVMNPSLFLYGQRDSLTAGLYLPTERGSVNSSVWLSSQCQQDSVAVTIPNFIISCSSNFVIVFRRTKTYFLRCPCNFRATRFG